MTLLHLFAEQADRLLLGVTAVLTLGCVAAMLIRSPATRKVAIETTFVGCLLWLAFAFVPRGWIDAAIPSPKSKVAAESIVVAEPPKPIRASEPVMAVAMPVEAAVIPPLQMDRLVVPEPIATPQKVASEPVVDSTSEQPVAQASIDWRLPLTQLWLAGVAASLAYLAVARMLLSRILKRAFPAPEWIHSFAADCCGEGVRLLVSPLVTRPFCFGVRRPTILLPEYCTEESRRAAVAHVLRHEVAHIRHRDAAGRRLANLLLPVLYFHPLYWRLRSQWVLAAELIADDAAARSADPVEYVRELTDLVRARRRGLLLSSGLSVFAREGDFSRRMRMLLQRKSPLAADCPRWRRALLLTAVVGCVAAVGVFVLPPAIAINASVQQNQEPQSAKGEITRWPSETDKPDPIRTIDKSVGNDPKLFELHSKRVELSQKFGRSHPEMVAIEAKIKAYTEAKQESLAKPAQPDATNPKEISARRDDSRFANDPLYLNLQMERAAMVAQGLGPKHPNLVAIDAKIQAYTSMRSTASENPAIAAQAYVADGKWRATTSPGYWHYVRWTGKNWQWAHWTGKEHEFTEAPTKAKPVTPPPYVLGPSDKIRVESLELLPNRPIKGQFEVGPDGSLHLPYYGDVMMNGRTAVEAVAAIYKRLAMEVNSPEIDFEIIEYNSAPIYISAMGKTPTRLPSGKTHFLFDALVAAGFSAGDETAVIYREGGGNFANATFVASLNKLWMGIESENYQLFPSDRIVVVLSGHPVPTPTNPTPVQVKPASRVPTSSTATSIPEPTPYARSSQLEPPSRSNREQSPPVQVIEKASAPSVPMLAHQLRMAEAEIAVAKAKFEAASRQASAAETRIKSGTGTRTDFAELARARSAVEISEAEYSAAKLNAASLAKLAEELIPKPNADLQGAEKDVERIASLPREQQATELMKMPLVRQLAVARQVERKIREKSKSDKILPADVEAEVQRIASLPYEQHELEIVKKPMLLRKAYSELVEAEFRKAHPPAEDVLKIEVERLAKLPPVEREKQIDAKPPILRSRFRNLVERHIDPFRNETAEVVAEVRQMAALPQAEREMAINAKPRILQKHFRELVEAELKRSTGEKNGRK